MSNRRRIAVIAGTTVDTRMGVEFIERKNREADGEAQLEPVYLPVAEDCDAQIRFQYSDADGKRAVLDNLFNEELEKGTADFFIYCNSLSGAFDFDSYAVAKSLDAGRDIRVYTPLQVYRQLAGRYSRVGVMAAHNLSAHAIEETIMSVDPGIYVIGAGNMAVVHAVEDGLPPEEIVEKLRLGALADYMKACGAETIILGCTHFPYFKEELQKLSGLPLIDPADMMYEAVLAAR